MTARRREPLQAEKIRVWAAAAGRCEICGTDLLEGRITHVDMTLGELAHIVGAQGTEGSPRGQDAMSEEDRAKAENLLLICANHHDEIDRQGSLDTMTIERLRKIKRAHEEWVAKVTGLDRDRSTAVLRVIGNLRGKSVDVPRPAAAAAVLKSDDRFPDFPFSLDRSGIEIDLREIPGEAAPDAGYWATAAAKIDEVIANQLAEAIRKDRVSHVSVFAFARLPLLVYLGAALDDNIAVEVYQRHRATDAWAWIDDQTVKFTASSESPPDGTSTDAVLILNVSGTVSPDEIQEDLRPLPRVVLAPATVTPGPDIMSSRQTLLAFEDAVRALFADLEATAKGLRRLHVFGALPLSAAVGLGRAHDAHIRPALAIYSRDDATGAYSHALDIA
ncbi:MAG: SAVED domain-containing protein [Chloroflexota bacterium]